MKRAMLPLVMLLALMAPASAAILLPPTAITAAISSPAVTGALNIPPSGVRNLTIQFIFTYGSSGTSVDAYVQTSFDNGATWIDIRNFHATTASLNNIVNHSSATVVTTAVAPSDGSMASNTSQDGVIGSKLRVKYKSSGTYAGGTTLAIYAGGTEVRP